MLGIHLYNLLFLVPPFLLSHEKTCICEVKVDVYAIHTSERKLHTPSLSSPLLSCLLYRVISMYRSCLRRLWWCSFFLYKERTVLSPLPHTHTHTQCTERQWQRSLKDAPQMKERRENMMDASLSPSLSLLPSMSADLKLCSFNHRSRKTVSFLPGIILCWI